jgi:ABC-type Fe3+/spermidine/putrescine transport system ATPase subunit
MLNLKKLRIDIQNFALRDIDLHVSKGKYFMLVGPTGAGKTFLLETIAGLRRLHSGEIWLNGENISAQDPERRGIGIVYQDCALFPHLSVAENITFGLKIRRVNPKESRKSLADIQEIIGIGDLLQRKPGTLSGGERQKVALARSLIVKPKLLLLDEPLSALDPATRETVREELRTLHQALGITTIHVTHDFEEAISLGNEVAVVGDGMIRQVGTPEQVFRKPNSEFVARFTMTRNIYPGQIRNINGRTVFTTSGTDFITATTNPEGEYQAVIRPEDITISPHKLQAGTQNCLEGTIKLIIDRGATLSVCVDVPPEMSCLITRQAFQDMKLHVGQRIYANFEASAIHILSK